MPALRLMRILPLSLLLLSSLAFADHLLLQVEDFDGPWKKQKNISGYQGKGFRTSNANPDIADTVLQYTATLQKPGPHHVWMRAYTSPQGNRALQLELNGQRLSKTHAGKGRQWSWEKAGVLDLPAGELKIVVHDADVGYESADAILITDQDTDPAVAEAEEKKWRVYDEKPPRSASALHFNISECADLLEKREDPTNKTAWEKRRDSIKTALQKALGLLPFPPRTPLNAQITGRSEHDGYTIENVVYESRPDFLVTANLYLPKNIVYPAPAIVVTAGHAMETGKNSPIYQMAQLGLVRQGFIVFAIDPIGQGERLVPGMGHNLGYGSLLLGRTNEGYIIWDTLRALDYVVTRKEVDTQRIGLAGNSGGGECVFYTMPFDERFTAAGSFSFVCSYDQWIRHGGNHCICNHFPNIFQYMEEFEILGLNAPRPFLCGNGVKDSIFPIIGARHTRKRAQKIYAFYNAEENLQAAEAPEPHGWSQPLREACYGFMNLHLQNKGDGAPIPEGQYEANDPESPDLLCFDGEKIPDASKTMVQLNQEEAERLRTAYNTPPATLAEWTTRSGELKDALWECFGGQPKDITPTAETRYTFAWRNCDVTALALTTDENMEVPALFLRPKNAPSPCAATLYLAEKEKKQLREDANVATLLDQGIAILAIDPRGLGECHEHDNHLTSDTVCLGRPIFAQRVWDVMQALRYLQQRSDIDANRVRFYGKGANGLHGIFAGALGAPFQQIEAHAPLASFRFFLENDQPQPIWLAIPNLLKHMDLAQVAALCAQSVPLTLIEPAGYANAPLTTKECKSEFNYTHSILALLQKDEHLLIKTP